MSVAGLVAFKDALGEDDAMREELRQAVMSQSSEPEVASTAGSS